MVSRCIHKEFIQWVEPDTPYSEAKSDRISKDNINFLNDYLKVAPSYEEWCKKNHIKPSKMPKGYTPPKHPLRPDKPDEAHLWKCYFCCECFTDINEFTRDQDRHFLNGDFERAMVTESFEQRQYIYNRRHLNGKFVLCGPINPEYKAEFILKGGKRMEREWLMKLEKMTPQEWVGYHKKKEG
jgi:hypothetical protein